MSMPLFLRVHPGGRQYRLPDGEDAGEVIKSLAEVLGNRGCVVLGYELPEQPRSTRVGIVSPPVRMGTPVMPSRPTAAISAELPSSIVWRREMMAVVGKYT